MQASKERLTDKNMLLAASLLSSIAQTRVSRLLRVAQSLPRRVAR